jgi:secreted trypsin-like serine protease
MSSNTNYMLTAKTAGLVNYITPQIVGGNDAVVGQWPWQAFIYMDNSWLCGGSLIMPNWILTAAHCAAE